jgi:hypothetical protein
MGITPAALAMTLDLILSPCNKYSQEKVNGNKKQKENKKQIDEYMKTYINAKIQK